MTCIFRVTYYYQKYMNSAKKICSNTYVTAMFCLKLWKLIFFSQVKFLVTQFKKKKISVYLWHKNLLILFLKILKLVIKYSEVKNKNTEQQTFYKKFV